SAGRCNDAARQTQPIGADNEAGKNAVIGKSDAENEAGNQNRADGQHQETRHRRHRETVRQTWAPRRGEHSSRSPAVKTGCDADAYPTHT
ncbi:MAG TPA: hypothetical protein VG605_12005, partial [Puia sp.]|nr:hypothetical protein [Puia sp.]